MSSKAQTPAARATRGGSPAKAGPTPSPEPAEPHPADTPARRSEPHMQEIGGSGLALWDEALLLRTMQTLRPPILREGETAAQHKMEIVGLAGTALAAFKPKDAVEAMIASQAVALHFASMECSRRAMLPEQTADVASRLRKDAANSARAMVDMTEALERRRGRGPQVIRVEKMLVADGGQAVVGTVTAGASLPASGPIPQAIEQGPPTAVVPDVLPVVAGDRGGGGDTMIQCRTIDPMSPRCGARTRQGGSCGQLPMANGRCHFHGGLSTGPRTPEGLERMRAAKTIHGGRAADMRDFRRWVRQLRADARRTVEAV